MREALRKGVRPNFRTADGMGLSEADAEKMRESGFGALLAAPGDELIAGQSAVLLARTAAARDQVLVPVVWQHAAFDATGGGYPSTLMGYMAALRQLFLDANRHALQRQRVADGIRGPRPPHDPDLEALMPVLAGKQILACEAQTDRDIRRWLRLAQEFDLRLAITGGRDAWQTADRLQAAKAPVILTLDWGDEAQDPKDQKGDEDEQDAGKESAESDDKDDGGNNEDEEDGAEPSDSGLDFDYSEPEGVLMEKRRRWEERRDCAMRLAEAGIPFAFGSAGESPKELLGRVRTLVEEGLDEDVALAALTSQAAEIFGLQGELGSLEAGGNATLCLWTGDPLDTKSQVRWAFVDGFRYEYEVKASKEGDGPAEGVDLSGSWTLTYLDEDGEAPVYLTLEMDDEGAVSGEAKATNPQDQSEMSSEVEGLVDGEAFEFSLSFVVGDLEVDVIIEGEWNDGSLKGNQTLRFSGQEVKSKFVAEKDPKQRAGNQTKNQAVSARNQRQVQR